MIWTIPNILTIFRVLLVPVFVYFVLGESASARVIALVIFFVAAITDYLDGRLARIWNQRSEFGNFADPLADKLLVAAALVSFVLIPDARVPLWAVLLILAREVLITGLRVTALRRQETVETSFFGKFKTASQMITIVVVLILLVVQAYIAESLAPEASASAALAQTGGAFWAHFTDGTVLGKFLDALPLLLILITCFCTVYSGVVYLWVNRKLFSR